MDALLANEIDIDSFPNVFEKQLTFRQLYAFLKSRKELAFNRDIPQSSYLCGNCKNILLLSKEIASSAKIALANNAQLLIEDFSCNTQSTEFIECMHSTCVNCFDLELNMYDFHKNKESITFHQWIRIVNKIQKLEIELPSDEIYQKFKNDLKFLKKHIYVKRNNMRAIISLKKNLVKTRFYSMLIIVKTIATFSKVKCSALTLVTIPFLFSQLVVISVKNVILSMKISQ